MLLPRRLNITCFKHLINKKSSSKCLDPFQDATSKRFINLDVVLKHESLVVKKDLTPESSSEVEEGVVPCRVSPSWVWEEGQPPVVHSPIQDIHIPETHFSHTIWSNVWSSNTSCYRAALVNGENGRTFSYKECERLSKNFASSLIKFGAEKGDVLALVLPNCPEFVFVFSGGPLAGVTVTTLSPNFTHFEVTQQLHNSGATWVVTDMDRFQTVQTAINNLEEASSGDQVVRNEAVKLVLAGEREQTEMPTGVISLSMMLSDDGSKCPAEPDYDYQGDVVVIPYSSGTTGPPKGVQLTHQNMVSNMYQISCPEMGLIKSATRDEREVTICVLPMYHVFAMNVTMTNVMMAGGKMVTLSSFNPLTFLNALITYKPTFLHLAPPLLVFLTTHQGVKPHHLESLRYILVGAAPVQPSLIREFKEKAPHVELREGWGMSELSPAACFSPEGQSVVGSCGKVIPNTKMKVVSVDTGEDLGPEENGELLVQGPQVMKGYLNNTEATNKTIINGWLYSGDLAKWDREGNIFMVDRMKEMIKVKALQVSPSELEDLLRHHHEVHDAAVLGIPNDRMGEVPQAFVVKKNRKAKDEEIANMIHEYINERVSDHKQIRGGIVFLPEVPRSPAGKILKKNLKGLTKVEAW